MEWRKELSGIIAQGILKWINTSKESNIEKNAEANLIEVCLGFEKKLISSENISKELLKENYLETIQQCLLMHSNELVRSKVANFLEDLILNSLQYDLIKDEFMANVTNRFIFRSISEGFKSQQFYKSLAVILKDTPYYLCLFKQETIGTIISDILNREIYEKSIRDCDYCLGGMLTLLHLIFSQKEQNAFKIDNAKLIKGLLDSLFKIEPPYPKCKHEETRKKALLLLEKLVISSFSSTDEEIAKSGFDPVSETLNYLTKLHITGIGGVIKNMIGQSSLEKNRSFANLWG